MVLYIFPVGVTLTEVKGRVRRRNAGCPVLTELLSLS